MKKILLSLILGMAFIPLSRSATVNISNFNNDGDALHGIANSEGIRLAAQAGKGYLGRMKVSDGEVQSLLEAKNIEGLIAAFEIFNPEEEPFDLASLGQAGAFESSISFDTTPSETNEFANSPIFVWLFQGDDLLSATEFLIAKLDVYFPEDSELPPEILEAYLNPQTATFFVGSEGIETHDYGFGGGAVSILKMEIQEVIPVNQKPVAIASSFEVITGQTYKGALEGTDIDAEDVLTYQVETEPTKGDLTLQNDGTFTYVSTAGSLGADSFTFIVSDGQLDSDPATVTINTLAVPPPAVPVIVNSPMPDGFVGTYYEYEIEISNLPHGTATSYSAKGLPTGLKLNTKTGLITGYPSSAVTDRSVILTAKNAQGVGPAVTFVISIAPVPPLAVGTFLARIERDVEIAGNQGGRLDLTVTSKGSFSAKLLSGNVAYTGKGNLNIEEVEGENQVSATISFIRKGFPTLAANVTLDVSDPMTSAFQISGSLADPAIATDESEDGIANLSGVRNTWSTSNKPLSYPGNYTYSLNLREDEVGSASIPQGYGFGAITVTDKGVGTFTGKTADGKAFTAASILGPQGHLPFFCALVGNSGSLVSMPQVLLPDVPDTDELNVISGVVSWSKPEVVDVKSKERAYRDGFEAFDLDLLGGEYEVPAAGGVVAALPDNGPTGAEANARLSFVDGGLADGDIDPFDFTIMNKKDTGITQTIIVPKFNAKVDPNPNPNTVTFKLVSKPAGYFSGTFIIPNEVKTLIRKVTYQGTFVRHQDGSFSRVGYFLLAELPDEDNEKVTTTPMLSGGVELDALSD